MSHYRSMQLGRWARALGVAVGYLAVTATLLSFDVGDLGLAPPWVVIAVPPFFYAALSRVLLRRPSLNRRLSWIGGACLTHLTLGVAVSIVVGILDTLTPLSALAHVFVRLGPGSFLTLVATSLVLVPFGARVLSSRPAPRAERTRQAVVFTPPAPGQTPFAREPRRREVTPEPAAMPAGEAPAAPPELPPDDAVVRVRFERVANQLPAKAFTLPLDRVAESLREPHWLTVPRRVVVALLPEGAVQVDWAILASQFPPLAFSVTDVEFRRQYPDLKLTLPLDDLLRQLPPGVFSTGGSPSQIAGLDAFPPPFEPLAVPREAPAASPVANDTPGLPPGVVMAPPAAAPVAPPAPAPAAEPQRFAAATPMITPPPPAPVASAPSPPIAPPPPPRIAPPSRAPIAPPPPAPLAPPPHDPVAESLRFSADVAPPPVAPARVSAAAPPPAPPREAPREAPREVIDREALARLAACFAGAGTFESWSGVVEGVPLVAFLSPSMPRAAVTTVAARVAGLLGAAAGEQVTVRTARAAIVVTAAPMPVVVAAPRPGAPVALLELRGARAGALVGRAGEGAAPPSRALSVLAVDRRVADVAGTLGAFGDVEPAVLTDPSGGARVYVFREPGREAERLGELALAVWDGLGRTRDADLGALVSVVFRQGRRRILVRALGGRGTALLAAAGPVARPGRAWREADRAAAALEAR